MPMSVQDRVEKASAARIANARRRRFQKYLREMRATGLGLDVVDSRTGHVPAEYMIDALAFPVPVDEQRGRATTQPSGR